MSTRLSNTRMHQLWLSLAILLASVTTCPLSLLAEELDAPIVEAARQGTVGDARDRVDIRLAHLVAEGHCAEIEEAPTFAPTASYVCQC